MMDKPFANRLVWISTINPERTLDLSTWIDTTRELGELGWRVTLLGKGPDGRHTVKGIPIDCYSTPDVYLIGHFIYLGKVIWRVMQEWRRVDTVLFHQDMALAVLPLRGLRLLRGGPRFIMDTRDFADNVSGRFKTKARLKFFRLIYKFNALFADGQTTITERMAVYAGVPSKSLLGTWPSGVDVQKFAPARIQRRWNGPEETIELIYIGSIVSKRNHIELARAVRAANDAGMNFRLTLYGNGDAKDAIARFAQENPRSVRLCEPVPHSEIPAVLAQAHVGVTSLPAVDDAKYMASSPIKLFEYMAAGMPILATANVCHVDVVKDGRYTFWAQDPTPESLTSALETLWAQRDRLAVLGEEAFGDAANWTWRSAAQKLSRALNKAVDQ